MNHPHYKGSWLNLVDLMPPSGEKPPDRERANGTRYMGPPEGKVLRHTVPDGAGWSAAHPLVTAHSRTARLLKPTLNRD